MTTCSPSSPEELWEKYKSQMAKDILHLTRLERSDITLNFTTEIYNVTLVMIEDLCLSMANKLLKHLEMSSHNCAAAISTFVELDREQSYNTIDLLTYIQTNISKLTPEQKGIYDQIIYRVDNQVGGIFFLDASGGIGKTFLIRLFLASF